MRKFRKISLFLSIILILSSSCSNIKLDDKFKEDYEVFKASFPAYAEKISYEHVQIVDVSKQFKSTASQVVVTFPVMQDNEVIGRYYGTEDETVAYYIDFSNYKNSITIYDVNDPELFQTINMIYDPESGLYVPEYSDFKVTWCEVSCLIGAVAIASSDGPSPLMDILAVSYEISCILACKQAQ
jgi:hypothetical protein